MWTLVVGNGQIRACEKTRQPSNWGRGKLIDVLNGKDGNTRDGRVEKRGCDGCIK